MSNFLTLYTAVIDSIGRDDTLAVTQAKRGVNFGQLIAGLVFNPVELNPYGNLTVDAASNSVSITSLTGIRLINSIYNNTGLKPVRFIPEDKFPLIVPSGLTYVEYYYRHGNYIYVNPPTAENTLAVKHTKFPTEMVNDADLCELTQYDPFIIAAANSYVFASVEEGDSQKIWDSAMQTFAAPFTLNASQLGQYKEALKASGHSV